MNIYNIISQTSTKQEAFFGSRVEEAKGRFLRSHYALK